MNWSLHVSSSRCVILAHIRRWVAHVVLICSKECLVTFFSDKYCVFTYFLNAFYFRIWVSYFVKCDGLHDKLVHSVSGIEPDTWWLSHTNSHKNKTVTSSIFSNKLKSTKARTALWKTKLTEKCSSRPKLRLWLIRGQKYSWRKTIPPIS